MPRAPRIYQFLVQLRYWRPRVWRRILVPEGYTFWDLHVAIQDSMGWEDGHLHEFQIRNPRTGTIDRLAWAYDDADFGMETLPDHETPIKRYFRLDNPAATYLYDFGDGWEHDIVLEEILPADPTTQYPACIDGEQACPPEDCGGIGGYAYLLEALSDPTHPEHADMLEWVGGEFDAKHFAPSEVRFQDTAARWSEVMEDD